MAHLLGLSIFKLEGFAFDRQWTNMAVAYRLSLKILFDISASSLHGGQFGGRKLLQFVVASLGGFSAQLHLRSSLAAVPTCP